MYLLSVFLIFLQLARMRRVSNPSHTHVINYGSPKSEHTLFNEHVLWGKKVKQHTEMGYFLNL